MVLFIVALGLFNFFYGELVPVNEGLGWDGVTYARLTEYIDHMISTGRLSSYYAQRILPSLIVRYVLLFSGLEFSIENIIRIFLLYNTLLLAVSCVIWKRISDNFSLTPNGRWIGFGGLFLSYGYSKNLFYAPVTTDATALLIGLLLLLFHVEKRPIALLATTVIGAFAWPVVSICGALLLFFLRTELSGGVISPAASPCSARSVQFSRWVMWAWFGLLGVCIMGFALSHGIAAEFWMGLNVKRLADLLTGIPSHAGAAIALLMLVGSLAYFNAVVARLHKTSFILIGLSIAAVLIPWTVVSQISNSHVPNPNGVGMMREYIFFPPTGKFLLPFVSLAVFWGPLVLLLFLKWQAFCREARRLGPGVVAVIGFSLPLGLANDPRYMIAAWPFFVLGGVLALEPQSSNEPRFPLAFVVLTLLYAQFWMKLNLAPWTAGDYEGLADFPKQMLFMHHGRWMNWWSYSLQLVGIGLSLLWLRNDLKRINHQEAILTEGHSGC